MTSLRAFDRNMASAVRLIPVALALSLILILASTACLKEDDLTPDQRAYALDRQFMCPVCDGQTIDESHAQIAQDMKQVIRDQIAAGKTNQEIRDYFVARYGEVVLASPEASGFNLIVWIVPGGIAIGGALIVLWVLRNMLRKTPPAGQETPETVADGELGKYLEKVDAEIGYHPDASTATKRVSESGKS